MIIPSTRLFTAGEVETGAYLNNSITAMSNFALGKPVFLAWLATGFTIPANQDTSVIFDNKLIDRDNAWSNAANNATATAISGSGTVVTVTATNSYKIGDNITTSGFTTVAYNLANQTVTSATSTQFTFASTATGATSAGSVTSSTGNRFVCKTAGFYYLSAALSWGPTPAVTRSGGFLLNGSRINGSYNKNYFTTTIAGIHYTEVIPVLQYLNVGDTVMLFGRTVSNAPLTTTTLPASNWLQANWVSL